MPPREVFLGLSSVSCCPNHHVPRCGGNRVIRYVVQSTSTWTWAIPRIGTATDTALSDQTPHSYMCSVVCAVPVYIR